MKKLFSSKVDFTQVSCNWFGYVTTLGTLNNIWL